MRSAQIHRLSCSSSAGGYTSHSVLCRFRCSFYTLPCSYLVTDQWLAPRVIKLWMNDSLRHYEKNRFDLLGCYCWATLTGTGCAILSNPFHLWPSALHECNTGYLKAKLQSLKIFQPSNGCTSYPLTTGLSSSLITLSFQQVSPHCSWPRPIKAHFLESINKKADSFLRDCPMPIEVNPIYHWMILKSGQFLTKMEYAVT